ncbi:HAD family hydrolase [Corynebacterium sp. ES2794-CONJ1]|uniref:heavy metal translocating P-type ATPase n=1 Tax=unclassified Corynebacterium TaxID=2624378 RepID=UPI00216A8566|nr:MULTISPECIES: HAD family hydrolase [unclassified Corynebacterium]MCS4489715.1 HAD family hydrolase [Corynebacterium sp. ES2775-CONJ]MCU9519023.1 HAD family hydrolase [Corynebacterium sp. ES2794-CONJ1]
MDQNDIKAIDSRVLDAIASAKKAAKRVGISSFTLSDINDPEEAAAAAISSGRTSFAFELKGLENAASVAPLEEAINDIEGVEARIVYTSSMAWVSAIRTIDIQVIEQVFARHGITARLTDSSIRRRMAWSDVEEGRISRSQLRQRRRQQRMSRGARKLAEEEQKDFALARREGFLEGPDRHIEPQDPTDVLFTARSLITKARLIVSLLLTIPVVVISYDSTLQFDYWQWVLALIAFPVVTYGAYPFHRAMLGGFRRSMFALDAASSLAIIAAYVYSVLHMLLSSAGSPSYRVSSEILTASPAANDSGVFFFDVACTMTLFLLAGRLLSRKTRKNLVDELAEYLPAARQTALRVTKQRTTGAVKEEEVAVQKLNVGDDLIVAAGDIIPVDGIVIGGSSTIDGRALGIGHFDVKVKSTVYAGCINGEKNLKVRAIATGHRTWLVAIARWIRRSGLHQNYSDALATRSASLLVPAAIMGAVTVFSIWALLTNNYYLATATALSMMGCVAPVSLAVSASVATRQGIEAAARRGVLIRDSATVRRLDMVDTVIFNRVGALSEGEMSVETVTANAGENADLVIRVAGALCMESEHPVSLALVRAARESRDTSSDDSIPSLIEVSHQYIDEQGSFGGVVEIPMRTADGGMEMRSVEAKLWRPRNLSDVKGRLAAPAVSGGTPLVVRWKGQDRGVITLHDEVKPDANDSIEALEDQGIDTMMLSRDTYPVARRYGDMVGVSHVLAGIQPGNKPQTVRSVHNHGRVVAVVGDDSAKRCFRAADVGVMVGAMASMPLPAGLETTDANVVLLRGLTEPIPWLFTGAKRMNRLINNNFLLAWTYNIAAMTAAALGLLHPMGATILMLAASLIIEARSMWIKTF